LEKTSSIPCLKPLVTDDRIPRITQIEEKKVDIHFISIFAPEIFAVLFFNQRNLR